MQQPEIRQLPLCPPMSEVCRILLAAWNNARGGDLVPTRRALRPQAIAPILSVTYILEYRSPDQIIYTLAGTAITESVGFPITGANHIDLVIPEERPFRRERWRLMAETPCGNFTVGLARQSSGVAVPFQSLCLPVIAEGHEYPLQFIGVVSPSQDQIPILEETGPQGPKWQQANLDVQLIDIGAGLPKMPAREIIAPWQSP